MNFFHPTKWRSITVNAVARDSESKIGIVKYNMLPLEAAALLLLIVVFSHAVAAAVDPRLPAAAVAMGIYLLLFAMTGGPDEGTTQLYRAAAAMLPMLFVPVASGVVTFGKLQLDVWILVTLVIVGGTLTTLLTVGLLAERVLSQKEGKTP